MLAPMLVMLEIFCLIGPMTFASNHPEIPAHAPLMVASAPLKALTMASRTDETALLMGVQTVLSNQLAAAFQRPVTPAHAEDAASTMPFHAHVAVFWTSAQTLESTLDTLCQMPDAKSAAADAASTMPFHAQVAVLTTSSQTDDAASSMPLQTSDRTSTTYCALFVMPSQT